VTTEAEKSCSELGFETCSEDCTRNLTTILQKEIDFGRITLEQRHPKTDKGDIVGDSVGISVE